MNKTITLCLLLSIGIQSIVLPAQYDEAPTLNQRRKWYQKASFIVPATAALIAAAVAAGVYFTSAPDKAPGDTTGAITQPGSQGTPAGVQNPALQKLLDDSNREVQQLVSRFNDETRRAEADIRKIRHKAALAESRHKAAYISEMKKALDAIVKTIKDAEDLLIRSEESYAMGMKVLQTAAASKEEVSKFEKYHKRQQQKIKDELQLLRNEKESIADALARKKAAGPSDLLVLSSATLLDDIPHGKSLRQILIDRGIPEPHTSEDFEGLREELRAAGKDIHQKKVHAQNARNTAYIASLHKILKDRDKDIKKAEKDLARAKQKEQENKKLVGDLIKRVTRQEYIDRFKQLEETRQEYIDRLKRLEQNSTAKVGRSERRLINLRQEKAKIEEEISKVQAEKPDVLSPLIST